MTDSLQYMLLNTQNYFKVADEYVTLEQRFKQETLLEKLTLWMDMIVYPLFMVCSCVFFGKKLDMFAMMTAQKTFTVWKDWIRYRTIRNDVREWKKIVSSTGGPFISTNDEKYHVFVYADGMQRLYNALFAPRGHILTKERVKRL
jgi:hypothetical protein